MLGVLSRPGLFRWLLAVLLTCCLTPLYAASQPSHVAALAWLEDPAGNLTLDEVRGRELTPFSGLLSRGYTPSVIWIRLTLDPGSERADDDLIVRMRPSYLDEIRLFDPFYGVDGSKVSGDRYPIANDSYPSLYFNFSVPAGDRSRDIWLRLHTASTAQIHVDVLASKDALVLDRTHELMFMVYLAALLLFFGWGLVSWLSHREKVMGAFVIKQLIALLYSLAYLGYFRMVWPDTLWSTLTPDKFTSFLVLSMVTAAIFFDYHFLKEFRAHRGLLKIMQLLLGVYPVLLLLLFSGQIREALLINNLLVISFPVLSVVTALSIPAERQGAAEESLLPKRYVVTLYVLVLISVSMSSLPAAGLVKGVEWTFSGYLMYSLFTGAMVLVMLQIRANYMRRQRLTLAGALRTAEQRAELEEARRLEQAQFLAMLTHELKTPLAVIRMVLSAPEKTETMLSRAEYAISSMGAVIERCLQVDRLEDNRIETDLSDCRIDQELRELVENTGRADRISVGPLEPLTTRLDVSLFRMIVANLLDNALKYGDASSPVYLLAKAQDWEGQKGLRVEVSNLAGKSGMPDAEQLFQKYYRDPKARKETGSGLGLFLVEGLARLMEGRVEYAPKENRVRFRLWIPLR